MAFILFTLILLSFFIGSFAIPFSLVFFAPGKRSAFLLTTGLTYYALRETLRLQENPDFSAIIEVSDMVYPNILYGSLFGGLVKFFLLFKKGKLKWQNWSYIDFLLVLLVTTIISGNFILGQSGLCLREGRVLNDEEVFPRYVVGKKWYGLNESERKKEFDEKIEKMQIRYYDVQRRRTNYLGNYRIEMNIFTRHEPPSGSRDYSERWLTLNACGFYNGSTGALGYTEEEIKSNHNLEKVMSYQSYSFK